jgi:hypothetical protein
MRPVDNFSAPRLARWSISVGACRRVGVCSVSRFIRRGSLGARGELLRVLGMRVDVVVFVAGVRGSLPHTPPGAFLQWSGRGSRIGMVEGPVAGSGDRHVSLSRCFVAFVRLNNLAQNHFRNVSAGCASHPCWSLLNACVSWS